MSTPLTNTTDIAARLACREPGWAEQSLTVTGDQTAAPANSSDGVALGSSPTTLLAVALRRAAHYRTVWVQHVSDYDSSAAIEITINGDLATVADTDHTTAAEMIEAIADAINASLTDHVTASYVTVLEDANGRTVIQGVSSADYSIDISSDGTDVLLVEADYATGVLVPAYTLDEAATFTAPSRWYIDADKIERLYGPDGTRLLRLNTGGALRGFARLEQLAGVPGDNTLTTTYFTPEAHWGPAQSET